MDQNRKYKLGLDIKMKQDELSLCTLKVVLKLFKLPPPYRMYIRS